MNFSIESVIRQELKEKIPLERRNGPKRIVDDYISMSPQKNYKSDAKN